MASPLLLGLMVFAPAFGVMYFVLGAQEEFFEHKAMFLALLGGLVLGILLGIAERFILLDAGFLFVVGAFTVIETLGKTAVVGLPRFRGNPETVLLGGALGATLAAMLMMFYLQFSAVDQPATWQLFTKVALAAVGFTGAHVVAGLRLGRGPAEDDLLSGILPAFGWLFPAHLFLAFVGLTGGIPAVSPLAGEWTEAIPLALYGVAIFVWRTPDLVRKGLPQEERRRWRREQRGTG